MFKDLEVILQPVCPDKLDKNKWVPDADMKQYKIEITATKVEGIGRFLNKERTSQTYEGFIKCKPWPSSQGKTEQRKY